MSKTLFFVASVLLSSVTLILSSSSTGELSGYHWRPNIVQLAFHGPNNDWGIRTLKGENVIWVYSRKGANNIFQYKSNFKANDECLKNIEIEFYIYFEPEYIFSSGAHKLALGFWGGGRGKCLSGGCRLQNQDGFSVRLMERQGYPVLYLYDFERSVKIDPAKQYGRGIISKEPFRTGVWEHVEIKANTTLTGRSEVELYINGKKLVSVATLLFLEESWCIQGPMLTDLWGGDVEDPLQWSKKNQYLMYKGYRALAW